MNFIHISKGDDQRICSAIVLQGTPPELEGKPYVDSQGEWYKMATVKAAAMDLMEKTEKICFDVQHAGGRCFYPEIIESFVADQDMEKWGTLIKKGAWVMTIHVDDERIWKLIREKTLNSFIVAGVAEE